MYKIVLLAFITACDVGSVTGPGAESPDASGGGGGGSADASGGGGGAAALSTTFTTSPTPGGGQYAPNNVVVVWVEGTGGAFVKTIGRWANTRKGSLVAWNAKAPAGDADAVSGATRSSHTAPLTATWDLKNAQNAIVADGTYTIRMELTDLNANNANQNNQGTFTFVKGASAQNQTGLTNGGYSNVSINFTP